MLRHIAPLVLAQLASSSLLHQPALKQMIRPWCLNSHFVLRLEMVQTQCRKKIAEYIRFSWFSYVRIHQNCIKWLHVRSPVWICPYTRHRKEVADLQPVNSAASPSGGFTVRLRSYIYWFLNLKEMSCKSASFYETHRALQRRSVTLQLDMGDNAVHVRTSKVRETSMQKKPMHPWIGWV
jgi:hypothetical protein